MGEVSYEKLFTKTPGWTERQVEPRSLCSGILCGGQEIWSAILTLGSVFQVTQFGHTTWLQLLVFVGLIWKCLKSQKKALILTRANWLIRMWTQCTTSLSRYPLDWAGLGMRWWTLNSLVSLLSQLVIFTEKCKASVKAFSSLELQFLWLHMQVGSYYVFQ